MNEQHIEQDDKKWMQYAMKLAEKAQAQGEIPVGALIVKDGVIVGEGWNQSITLNDPTAHAEIMALRDAGNNLQNYRIVDATMYVSLEPCPMCTSALIHARIKRLVFGASDYKTGAIHSVMKLLEHDSHNHKIEVTSGIRKEECSKQISSFFKQKRAEKKLKKKPT